MSKAAVKKKTRQGLFYLGIGTLIPALVMLFGFILIKVWPFGDGTVLIIDSLHQYLPFYTDFHEKLVHGDSLLYSFSGGLGFDFWATYAYYMASPFNFLIALVPTANVGDFMDLMILIKVSLCGGIFSWYLHQRDPGEPFMPLVFGTMYALGNFLIGYYFNLMWLDSIAVTPLIMLGIERIAAGKSGRMYGLSLFYGLWCNYYIGFMLCLFSCMYLMISFLAIRTISLRSFLRRSVSFAWYSLLAGGMASVVLLPAYRALTASEAIIQNEFPTSIRFYTDFLHLIYAHFIAEHPINISDTQVGLNAYCGVIVLILVLLYVLDERIALRERIGKTILAFFLLAGFCINYLNYMWHGFHRQNGLPNRFAFLYVLVILVMSYDTFRHIHQMQLWKLLLAGTIVLVFTTAAVLTKQVPWEDYGYYNYLTPALVLLYLLLMILVNRARFGRELTCVLLGGFMLIEAAAHGIYGIEYNENVTRSIYLEDQASYKTLMNRTGDTDFFRSEIDRQRMRNVTIFAGGHSIVMFNSTMQASVIDFCDQLGIEARTNKNGYLGVTRLLNSVFGIRYVLSPDGKGDVLYGFDKVDEDGKLTMYKNENALSLGFMVNPEIRYWDPSVGTPMDVQNDFVSLAVGQEGIYVLDRTVNVKDNESTGIKVPEDKQVYLYLPDKIDEITLDTPEYKKSYKTYTDHLYVINSLGEDHLATVTCDLKSTQDEVTLSIYTCSNEACQNVVDALSSSQMTEVAAEGNHLSGEIDSDQDGIMLLTIPYSRGWQVSVDGEKVNALKIGGALTGIELLTGHHTISMTYMPDGLKTGLLLTLLCACAFALTIFLEENRKKKGAPRRADWFMNERIYQDLCSIAGEDQVSVNEPMNRHTTFRIGGPADFFVSPTDVESLRDVIAYCRTHELPWYVIGNGSNLLVGDKGFRGVILQLSRNWNSISIEGNCIYARAGALLSVISKQAMASSLTGLEFASGIPGTLGGALVMNAGAYGGEMKQVVTQVRVLTQEGEILVLSNEQMQFGYRTSIVEKMGYIVLDAQMMLTPGDLQEISDRMEQLKEQRTMKQPLDLPSAGSTFKRPEGYFAGKLIMDAGLKGFRVGGAAVSEKHCGFVVNTGGATAQDVTDLMGKIQETVEAQFGVKLEPEVKRIGEF